MDEEVAGEEPRFGQVHHPAVDQRARVHHRDLPARRTRRPRLQPDQPEQLALLGPPDPVPEVGQRDVDEGHGGPRREGREPEQRDARQCRHAEADQQAGRPGHELRRRNPAELPLHLAHGGRGLSPEGPPEHEPRPGPQDHAEERSSRVGVVQLGGDGVAAGREQEHEDEPDELDEPSPPDGRASLRRSAHPPTVTPRLGWCKHGRGFEARNSEERGASSPRRRGPGSGATPRGPCRSWPRPSPPCRQWHRPARRSGSGGPW